MKTLYITNMGDNITREDIVSLFGLEKTDRIKRTSQVGIIHGKEEKTAILEVLDPVAEDILKLSGIEYKDKKLIISTKRAHSANAQDENIEEIQHLEIDARIPAWIYSQVSDIEIADALEQQFPDDPTKSVEDLGRFRRSLQGLFRVDSCNYEY